MNITEDQNKIKLDNGIEISFVAIPEEELLKPHLLQCDRCIIQKINEVHCCDIPCSNKERKDKNNGFFKF